MQAITVQLICNLLICRTEKTNIPRHDKRSISTSISRLCSHLSFFLSLFLPFTHIHTLSFCLPFHLWRAFALFWHNRKQINFLRCANTRETEKRPRKKRTWRRNHPDAAEPEWKNKARSRSEKDNRPISRKGLNEILSSTPPFRRASRKTAL